MARVRYQKTNYYKQWLTEFKKQVEKWYNLNLNNNLFEFITLQIFHIFSIKLNKLVSDNRCLIYSISLWMKQLSSLDNLKIRIWD